MSRPGPRQEFLALRRFITRIEKHFLIKHLSSVSLGAPTKSETLDVAAYVVLAHGALENFVEGVSLWALNHVQNHWLHEQRATRSTASLLLYRGTQTPKDEISQSVFDILRLALDDAKVSYSHHLEQNHGVTMKDLRSLFRPLGIDLPEDPTLVASLELLISMRHEWAHQYRFGAKTVKTASDVRTTVADCVTLAERLADSARKARP